MSGSGGATASSTGASKASATSSGATGGAAAASSGAMSSSSSGCQPLPDGWQGPVVFQFGNAACTGGWMSSALDNLSMLKGSPCQCTCGSVMNAQCTFGDLVHLWAAPGCAGNLMSAAFASNTSCAQLNLGGMDIKSIKADALNAQPYNGTCDPQALDGANLYQPLGLCDPGPGCASDWLQQPPPQGYAQHHCLYQMGQHMCPAGFTSLKAPMYQNIMDSRTCSNSGGCACGGPMGVKCSAKLQLYSDGGCNNAIDNPIDLPHDCKDYSAPLSANLVNTSVSGGKCQPAGSGGMLQGDPPTFDAMYTLCCN